MSRRKQHDHDHEAVTADPPFQPEAFSLPEPEPFVEELPPPTTSIPDPVLSDRDRMALPPDPEEERRFRGI